MDFSERAGNRIPFSQVWMTLVYDKNLTIVNIINPQHGVMLQLTFDTLSDVNLSNFEKNTEESDKIPAQIIVKNVRKAFREGRNVYFEYSVTQKDGAVVSCICYSEQGPDNLLYVNILKIDEKSIFETQNGFTNHSVEQHALLDSIYEHTPIGIVFYDKNGEMVLYNQKIVEIFDVQNKKEEKGFNIFESPGTPNEIKERLRKGENVDYEVEFDFDAVSRKYLKSSKTGKCILSIKSSIIRNKAGDIEGYLLSAQDQTLKVKHERLLEETATKFSAMFDAMSNGVEIYDKDGILVDCNEADLNIFGVENKEYLLNHRISLYNNPNIPSDRLRLLQKGETLSFNTSYDFDLVKKYDYFSTNKSGSIIIEVKIAPMYIDNKTFIGYVSEINDVTKVVEKDNQLKDMQRDLTLAMNAGNIAAWSFDVTTQIFSTLHGNTLAGKRLTWDDNLKMMHPEDAQHLLTVFNAIIYGGREKDVVELRYVSDEIEGGYRYYESSMIGVKTEGKVLFVIGTQKEITDDILIRKQLEEAHQKSSLILNNLLSGMVHIDNDFVVVWENLSVLKRSGRANKYKVGRKCYETVFNRNAPCENCIIKKVRESGQRTSITEFEENGTVLNITADIVKDKANRHVGYIYRLSDITEAYNYRIQLEQSHNDLNLALEAGNLSAWAYDVESKMFSTLQGDALAGEGISMEDSQKMLHPEDRQMQLDIFNAIARGEQNSGSAVFRYILPNGSYHHMESKMIATTKNGKVTTITGTQKDITREIEHEQELIRLKEEAVLSNQILNRILDNIPSILDVRNANNDFRFVLVNKLFCDYIGRPLEQVIGHKDTEIFDERNAEKCNYYDKLVVETGQSYSYHDCVTINGESRYWRISKSPLQMANGDTYTVCVGTDMTEIMAYNTKLKAIQKETESTNKILNEIIDHIPGGIYIKDTSDDFRYLRVNKAFCDIAGKPKSEIVGYTDFDVFDFETASMIRELDLKLRNGEKSLSYPRSLLKDNKQEYWQVNKSHITTRDNNNIILAVASDVTKYITINQELERAKTKAEESDKLKSAFLANMSHEIRTPLNAIVGFSELLQTVEDEKERDEYIHIINRNNDMLLRLIGDILDLSKIESGLIEFKPEVFDVNIVFNETYAAFNNRCTNPNVKLRGISPYKSCIVTLDRGRMLQVGTNFLSNAIKYTSEGEIIMGYEYINDGLRLYVQDTGIGIPKDKQQLLFQRFTKLDDFAQGTGLGLAICKAVIDANGGKIGCESAVGKGSTFWAWFPCKAVVEMAETKTKNSCVSSPKLSVTPKVHHKKASILVAEDNDSNYLLVEAVLKDNKLTRAKNGAEAVVLAFENNYDVILMDIKMPVMGGLEATRKIREFNKEIPIIALTSNVFDSDKVDAIKAGCNDFISKPLRKQEIERLLWEKYLVATR